MGRKVELVLNDVEWVDTPTAAGILGIGEDTFNEKIRVDSKFVQMGIESDLVRGRFSQFLLRKYARREYK
ncbi:hypothetical protein [uncultured Weissella sp.]|uniref:hypothetical protein n=1 Tax=Weissella viridescens TaxID=1629 RepID=UPI0027DE500D|nr:hypothetical protein [uncultured Weissella sp.]